MNKGRDIIKLAYSKGYRSTKDGNIIGLRGNKLSLRYNSEGYSNFSIRSVDDRHVITTHRFIAYEKFGDKLFEEGIEVRHLDGDPRNNYWNNIDIGTHSENMRDLISEKRLSKAKHASSFITIHKHKEIIDYYNNCRSYKKTIEEFNISSKGTLHYILNKSEASQQFI